MIGPEYAPKSPPRPPKAPPNESWTGRPLKPNPNVVTERELDAGARAINVGEWEYDLAAACYRRRVTYFGWLYAGFLLAMAALFGILTAMLS